MRVMALFSTSFFATCLHVDKDGPRRGHLCHLFVCVEVSRPSQPNGVMSSAVSLPNHTFTGKA